MKKIITTITIAMLSTIAIMAENQRVAVFNPAGNADQHVNEIVREIFSSVIVNTDGYVVLERSLIDRVLAENRFQAEGLVDDAQISEMGRMMGANLAFVTSLTRMSDGNFFVSARLIDVTTARIERQQTARTSRASETELITTTERLAREMFAQTAQPPTRAQQPARQQQTQQPTRPAVETPPVMATADMLVADRRRVLRGGVELEQDEVRQIISNANNFSALQLYDRAMRRNKVANTLWWTVPSGIFVVAATGFTFSNSSYAFFEVVGFSLFIAATGTVVAIVPITLLNLGSRNDVRNAVSMHNRSLNRADNTNIELNFGITQNGVGLVLNF
ncbi:MAG: CsgG/HfaB family protein [Bacteroidales bacterium]|nr:CsgG/HfaB family protein [Bacteroidales bacterium]